MIRWLRRWRRFFRITKLPYEVLKSGSVRDLERLEDCYRRMDLDYMVEFLRYKTGGNYASYVLHRDSFSWTLKIR